MTTSESTGVAGGAELDWRSVEWSRVGRAVYEVQQRYAYSYTAPVTDVRQRLVMVPRDRHGDQRLLEHHLTVDGAEDDVLSWREDPFGNRQCQVRAASVAEQLQFEARYRVQRTQHTGTRPGAGLARTWDRDVYTEPTALTAPDARLRAAAASLRRDDAGQRALAERVLDWAAQSITYQLGVTGVQTPAAMALHLGKGVCQDYAHIMLATLRLLGIPARYVSGHLLGEGAPHAWVEVLLEDANDHGVPEVVALDPTHRRQAGLNYITVAVGRDYADIAPTSGTFTGPATGRLTAAKHAEIVEIAYDDGTVAWPERKMGESAA
jgi:transglutaminase-like putative cysteine protease